jgi:hypothetical protein
MDDVTQAALVSAGASVAGAAVVAGSIGYRATELGHELGVERTGRRFRMRCSCGWATQVNWSRRTTMQAVVEHAHDVVSGRVAPFGPAARL